MDSSIFFQYPDGDGDGSGRPAGSVRFLDDLLEDELATLLSYTQTRQYARDEVVIRRGDTDRGLYVVTAGRFEVVAPVAGRHRRKALLRPGDIFGELAFFDHRPRSADVRAVEDSEAVVMTTTGFDRLRLAHPQLALRFALHLGRVVSLRFREQGSRLAALGEA